MTARSLLAVANEGREEYDCGGVARITQLIRAICARRLWRSAVVFALAGAACLSSLASPVLAAPSSAASPDPTAERELPTLPPIPKLDPLPPTQAEIDDLQARLVRLRDEKLEDRREAVREVLEIRSKSVAAILSRLNQLAARADRDRMKRAMAQAKARGRRATSDADDNDEPRAPGGRPDLLVLLIEQAKPKDEGWRDLVELVALSRMLTHIGNTYAARGLIEIYVRFGEFMRVDVQNRLADLRDGAVPALIEARRHKAEKISRWAERQLDRLGKAAPSEAIRTENFEVLSDVLRAYGRTKDPDAARIVVSYASSERFQVREAARQAIAMLGEAGLWPLRDAYENVVGKRPRRDWSWDRTARELFFEYDRLHERKLHDLLAEGAKAAAEQRYGEMAKAYDAVLARSPQFDRAHTLVPGYLAYAERIAGKQPEIAEAALVRAERLATDPALKQRARSLRDTIRAEQQLKSGILDTYRLQSAVELDPSNTRAKQLLSAGDREVLAEKTIRLRWMTSGAIALIGFCAILFVLLRGRKRTEIDNTEQNDEGAPANDTTIDSSRSASTRQALETSASLAGVSADENTEQGDESPTSSALASADAAAVPAKTAPVDSAASAADLSAFGLDGAATDPDAVAPIADPEATDRIDTATTVEKPHEPATEPDPEAPPPKRRDPFEDY